MFDSISPLIHRKTRRTTQILANRFVDFFHNKIEAIRSDLFARQTPATNPFMDTQACNAKLPEFESMTEDQVNWLFMSKDMCNLGPLPVSIMKDWMDLLLPVLTKMINMSIETATMPIQLKEAINRPKMKKNFLYHEVILGLSLTWKLISNVIERAVSYQLTNYLKENDLEVSLQSAYKSFLSSKIALVKVHNDIVSAIDNQSYVILLLLDLSAAFDAVDHGIGHLHRLISRFGINGILALHWFKSYLEERIQVVKVEGSTPHSKDLKWGGGVPRELCRGL